MMTILSRIVLLLSLLLSLLIGMAPFAHADELAAGWEQSGDQIALDHHEGGTDFGHGHPRGPVDVDPPLHCGGACVVAGSFVVAHPDTIERVARHLDSAILLSAGLSPDLPPPRT